MNKALWILAPALAVSACMSTAGGSQYVEQGYERGDLAVAAIERQDWTAAERLLDASSVSANDPARLINLGKVYMATGRQGAALSAWRLALASPNHYMVETMGGRAVSTQLLAQQALASVDQPVRSATLD